MHRMVSWGAANIPSFLRMHMHTQKFSFLKVSPRTGKFGLKHSHTLPPVPGTRVVSKGVTKHIFVEHLYLDTFSGKPMHT